MTKGSKAVLNTGLIMRIKEDGGGLLALEVIVDLLANDGGWVDNVLKKGLVDRAEGAGNWADGLVTTAFFWLGWECTALANEDDLCRRLLLKFWEKEALDLTEESNLLVWNGNNDNLFIGFDGLGTNDLKAGKWALNLFWGAASNLFNI